MFCRSSNDSRVDLPAQAASSASPPSPPPPQIDVWSALSVTYYVRSPWEWVMKKVATPGMKRVDAAQDLPSEKQRKPPASSEVATSATPAMRRRRIAAKRLNGPSTLKLEITNPETGQLVHAFHGTSAALKGTGDKDELVRTLQRCRCENLNLSPPSILISWDVTNEECINVIGRTLPMIPESEDVNRYAVLKEPMGSQGRGIYFVTSVDEIHKIIDEHRQRATNEPDFLDNLIAVKGRIPSWAEVMPSLLICGRKFHIRTYVVITEKLDHDDLLDIYIYNRHEIRIAGRPIPENDIERDPLSHITNGALSTTTERVLLHEVDELTSRNLQSKTEIFVAEMFGKHLLPDITRRVTSSASQEPDPTGLIRKFAVAGLDIMVTEENRIYLLEVNVNPAAPPEAVVHGTFKEHLTSFFHDLVDLVVGKHTPGFLLSQDILVREGLLG